jgi:hypothetical protein
VLGVGHVVRDVACAAAINKCDYPHLLRRRVASCLLALGMEITDLQGFLGLESIATTRVHAETTVATLQRRRDQLIDPAADALVCGPATARGRKRRCWSLICWRNIAEVLFGPQARADTRWDSDYDVAQKDNSGLTPARFR